MAEFTEIRLLACRDCGQLHRAPGAVLAGKGLACVRCGSNLSRYPPLPIDVALALATAALILFLLANAYPIFVVSLEGRGAADRSRGRPVTCRSSLRVPTPPGDAPGAILEPQYQRQIGRANTSRPC